MVAMHGNAPSTRLLGRIRRGDVGGVILFGANIHSAPQLVALTRQLQQAASDGGQPPLLIATDQEGGIVKRVAWAPPTLSPPQMGALGDPIVARSQGKGTARVLSCAGINHNLAPVGDVPRSTASFMYQDGRTWSFDATLTASLTDAFSAGQLANGVLPTVKHFPGIGFALHNTDTHVVTISAPKSALAPGLLPYRRAIADDVPLIMLSNAAYTAYDPRGKAAGWSRPISNGLLRQQLGFRGISITDSLTGTAATRHISPSVLAVRAAVAGTDMVMLTGREVTSAAAFNAVLDAARDGRIPLSRLQASYHRILKIKGRIAEPHADSDAPAVNPPTSGLMAGGMLGVATTPVRTTWSATDGCHIAHYGLRRQRNGGTWQVQPLSSGLATAIVQPLPLGSTFRYGARATDGAGNISGWHGGAPFIARRTEESGPDITYRRQWFTDAIADASGGSVAFSREAGSRLTFRFSGSSVAWVASRGPHLGAASVSVDGRKGRKVDLHAATGQHRAIVFAWRFATNGPHVLTIVNNGTDGHPRIDVDAFVSLVTKV